jgi:regulator of sigma D
MKDAKIIWTKTKDQGVLSPSFQSLISFITSEKSRIAKLKSYREILTLFIDKSKTFCQLLVDFLDHFKVMKKLMGYN